ncbi:putative bifunctional diguanylate cyclase/phosphodiesterase [Thiohalocapsa marina]|uniref:putative bifunctional diguanylate cyclase/phosphodiesterase n=1 Tax=Thiohalocapsa marina TaxID=424902 RepID=UPI0036DC4A1B
MFRHAIRILLPLLLLLFILAALGLLVLEKLRAPDSTAALLPLRALATPTHLLELGGLLALALIVLLSVYLGVSRRAGRLLHSARASAAGRPEPHRTLTGNDELGRLDAAVQELVRRLARAVQRVSDGEKRLTRTLEAVGDGYWEYDPDTARYFYSPRLQRRLGYPPGSLEQRYGAWAAQIHPDDLEAARVAMRAHLQGGTPRFEHELRVRTADGDWLWVLARGQVAERDSQGRPLRLVGAYTDISPRRQAQEALRRTRIVFESANEGVLFTDPQSRVTDVNPAFLSLCGYQRDELIGRTPALLGSGHHDQAFFQALWQALTTQGQWQGELWNRRKNGEPFLSWVTIRAVTDKQGELSSYVGIYADITHAKAAEEQLERLVFFDALTGLPNRSMFRQRLAETLQGEAQPVLLFIDLDRFKLVNDTLGYAVADELLVEVTARIKAFADQAEMIARLGSDEFTVLFTDIDDVDRVAVIAQRIIDAIRRTVTVQGHEIFVDASIGISVCPDDGQDADTLIKHADIAMADAKQLGPGKYRFFIADMNRRNAEQQRLEQSLRRALENGGIEVHYQPKVRLVDGHIVGLEALVRWTDAERGVVPPGHFIPLAERTGLIVQLGERVLETALRQLARLHHLGHDDLHVAVNLAALQFQQPNLVERIDGLIHASGVPAAALELEITETTMMRDIDHAIAVMTRLRERGSHVTIDDFGTGYSSLEYLKRFPIDGLKIDQSFVRDLASDANDAAIVSAIIAMARTLQLEVVAEGVETAAQWDYLRRHGCQLAQGYYFSKPLPADELELLLQQNAPGNTPVAPDASEATQGRSQDGAQATP